MRHLVVLGTLLAGCGLYHGPLGAADERDVSGNYALSYDDVLVFRLWVGGGVREVTHQGQGVVDFGVVGGQPVTLDVGQFCARPEVVCPSHAFWQRVAITQPNLATSLLQTQVLTVVNDTVHALDGGLAASLGGVVSHEGEDRFLLGLGAVGGVLGDCAALDVSLARGRFSRQGEHTEVVNAYRTAAGQPCSPDAGPPHTADGGLATGADGGAWCTFTQVPQLVVPPGAAVDGIKEGVVFVGYGAGCAFGSALVGATLTIETGFGATRTGAFDPPPYRATPVKLPDAGLPDGGSVQPVDAGP